MKMIWKYDIERTSQRNLKVINNSNQTDLSQDISVYIKNLQNKKPIKRRIGAFRLQLIAKK